MYTVGTTSKSNDGNSPSAGEKAFLIVKDRVFFQSMTWTNDRASSSEKDADSADDAGVAIFASALRDGPRPERTPDNDPNLSRTGPTIGKPRKFLSRLSEHYSFSPNGRFAVYQDRSSISALPLDQPAGLSSMKSTGALSAQSASSR